MRLAKAMLESGLYGEQPITVKGVQATPFELMHVEVARYNALLDDEITPEEKQQVMGGNIARLMGLDIISHEASA